MFVEQGAVFKSQPACAFTLHSEISFQLSYTTLLNFLGVLTKEFLRGKILYTTFVILQILCCNDVDTDSVTVVPSFRDRGTIESKLKRLLFDTFWTTAQHLAS